MQEIDRLYKDKGVRVLGILTSTNTQENVINALKSDNAEYANIIAEGALSDYLKKYRYVPTTMFINKNSEHTKRFFYGGKTVDQFKDIIDRYLAEYTE